MANWYVSSVAWNAMTAWAAGATLAVGAYRRQLAAPAFGSERAFKVTSITTGITGGTEPAWNLGNNATTTDGGVTWTQIGGQEAEQLAGNWRAPLATIAGANTIAGTAASVVFVSSDHTDSQAATYQIGTSSMVQYFSVSRTGATLPPTDADYLAGATVGTTGANALNFNGYLFFKGFTCNAGNSSNNASLNLCSASGGATVPNVNFENCALVLNNTNASAKINVTAPSFSASYIYLKNTTMTFGAAGQSLAILGFATRFTWIETPSATLGTVPTTFITSLTSNMVTVRGVDLSALTGALMTASIGAAGRSYFIDCKTNASLTTPTISTTGLFQDEFLRFDNFDPSLNYFMRHFNPGAAITSDTAVLRTGGASDGVTSYSHKYVSAQSNSAATTFAFPLTGDWLQTRYATTGAAKTLTIYLIAFTAAIPNSETIWLETEVLNTASVPLAGGLTTRNLVPTTTGTNLSADTSAWDGGSVAARANTHVYALNDQIKLASNPGRVFICTTAGTSAGSEPVGYASAVDGGSVTDNTAVFRAGWRCTLTQALTPQVVGFLRARVMGAMASGLIFNVDPKLNIA